MTKHNGKIEHIEDGAFKAQQFVWDSQFHLAMAHKYGAADSLKSARDHLASALAAIDAALAGGEG
jgi:hypothetical protein